MVVELNLIKEGVSDCAYPAISNHGIGYIIGSEETRTVRPLEEGEQFYFACQVGWVLPYDSENLSLTLSWRTLQSNSILLPACGKKV